MAANLLKNKVDLTIYNRSQEPVEKLVSLGAKASNSITDAVQNADIIISMLSTPEVVKSLFVTEQKGIDAINKGAIWIDCSTVNPTFSEEMKLEADQRGIHFVDAPVAGTKPQAENAELVFFVGGNQANINTVQPYLEMMGKKVMHIGEVGKGASFKMLVNLLLALSLIHI